MKPNGTETIPGDASGKIGSPVNKAAPGIGFQTFGLKAIKPSVLIKPESIPTTAPVLLNFFQKIVNKITGKFELAASVRASTAKNVTLNDCKNKDKPIEISVMTMDEDEP